MPTREEYIWDCKMILEAAKITDDSVLDVDYIGYKIDQKRAKEIRDTYARNPVIEPVWMQDYGIFPLTPVNKAEDRSILLTNCEYSKAVIPPIVSIHDARSNTHDLGIVRISSANTGEEFHQISAQKMALIQPNTIQDKFNYFTRIGNSIYLKPQVRFARGVFILENPLDGYVLDDTDKLSGELINGEVYEVRSGNITYNGVIYYKGNTFTANAVSTFTGPGKVFLQTQKRRMRNTDEYPMSFTMAEAVLLKIWTQDYKIEAARVADLRNDAVDQFQALRANG